jgi:hypothetical protein
MSVWEGRSDPGSTVFTIASIARSIVNKCRNRIDRCLAIVELCERDFRVGIDKGLPVSGGRADLSHAPTGSSDADKPAPANHCFVPTVCNGTHSPFTTLYTVTPPYLRSP